jgi:hypothetical protein
MDAMPAKPVTIQLKRTVQIVPGVHNRIIWTNAVNGDFIGEVALAVGNPEHAMLLAQDIVAWVAEATRSVAPMNSAVLDQLNWRGQRRM